MEWLGMIRYCSIALFGMIWNANGFIWNDLEFRGMLWNPNGMNGNDLGFQLNQLESFGNP